MNWLTPIGFLGLASLIVLVVIYIIKPNYQNKRISSTYIWRQSLKYKKQRIPVSKIHNLLTFLCQVLILTALGVMLATPVIAAVGGRDEGETVIVIDASAGMRIKDSDGTRFERAVSEARKKVESTLDGGSRVSLILADDSPEFVFTRLGSGDRATALNSLDALYAEAEERCIYSAADISAAMTLAESVLESNPSAGVYFYTGTDYVHKNGVSVVNVATAEEWNVGILGCRAELDNDNHYRITVEAACYGKTDFITVYCKIHGVNGDSSSSVTLEKGEFFDPSAEKRELVFTSDDVAGGAIYSYDYIEAYVSVRDSLAEDNFFFLYGGKKSPVKIQYASSSPNNFFESALRSIRQSKRESFDVELTMLGASEPFATEGFDIYIFEHKMPDVLPTDGVVLLVDPTTAPLGSDLQIGSALAVDSSSVLTDGPSHELTKYTSAQRITIAKYNDIVLSEGYEELMFFNGRPVMLLRDTPEARVVVWAFDLNYSNLIALPDFSTLILNMFGYFVPEALGGNVFEVGESISLNGRGDTLTVSGDGSEEIYKGASGEFVPTRPATYTLTQTTVGGKELPEESFFVKIPASESDTTKTVEALPFTEAEELYITEYRDALLYFAMALVTLMFAEWLLEIKKNY